MKALWSRLDKFICKYIGIKDESAVPSYLTKTDSGLWIGNRESYKRHLHMQNLPDFLSDNLANLNNSNKEKLGIAIGKALASNLVITFENTIIKRENADA